MVHEIHERHQKPGAARIWFGVPTRHAVAKFIACFFISSIGLEIFWENQIADRLYDCTDDCGFGFLMPGSWVHETWPHRHVETVTTVVHHRSMDQPDTIKQSWSVAGLWSLWAGCFGASVAVSYFLARLYWISPNSEFHLVPMK